MRKLSIELKRTGNPFSYDGPELMNIATQAVFGKKKKNMLVGYNYDLGSQLYSELKKKKKDSLISESSTTNLWDPVKKNKLNLCSSAKKKLKVKVNGNVKELQADRSLFARLLIVSRSQRQVYLKELLGKYEFSAVPQSPFHYDGTMHLCQQKSELIEILTSHAAESLRRAAENGEQVAQTNAPTSNPLERKFSVATAGGMEELHAL